MSTPTSWRVAVAGVGLLAAALIAAGGALVGPERPAPAPAPAFTGRTTTVCPAIPEGTAMVTAVAGPDARAGGTVSLRRLDDTEAGTVRPGGREAIEVSAPTLIRADGPVSARTAAAVVASERSGSAVSSLTAANCVPAVGQGWLVGLRSTADETSQILLTNPDRAQISVNLSLFDADGQQVVPGARNLVLEKESTRVVSLAGLRTSDSPIAVHVEAGRGRVAVSALQEHRRGGQPAGRDLLPLAGEPSAELVIAGLPGGAERHLVTVMNPGDRRADVTIEALGVDGSYVPVGAEGLDVAPHSTAQVSLGSGRGDEPLSLRIRGSQPLLAGVLSEQGGDIAAQAASAPLRPISEGPVAADGGDGLLVLANPGPEPVSVLAHVRRGNQDSPRQVTVGAQSSVSVPIERAPASVEVQTPEGAVVHAGIVLRHGRGVAALALQAPSGGAGGVESVNDPRLG